VRPAEPALVHEHFRQVVDRALVRSEAEQRALRDRLRERVSASALPTHYLESGADRALVQLVNVPAVGGARPRAMDLWQLMLDAE
jgi:hypothetical protein